MTQASHGDTVKVHYTGKLEDGTVFDTSVNRKPLEFTIGHRQVIPGFEQAVVGMNPGQSKTTKVPADKAYGPHREELVLKLDCHDFPKHLEPKVGQQLEARHENGDIIQLLVTNVSGSGVTLDANHPLAGRDLTFEIQLLEIVQPFSP